MIAFKCEQISATMPAAQLKQRRTGKSMSRRSGQSGTIVIQSGWYRVRWRLDVEGQERRINMTAKIAPVVLDRAGNPKPLSLENQRKAREIVEQSGANSKQHFNRVVLGEVTFRQQAEAYLEWAVNRDREPIKDASTIEAALNKWISGHRRLASRERKQRHREAVGGQDEEVAIGAHGEYVRRICPAGCCLTKGWRNR